MSVLHVLFRVAGTEYALPASDVLHMDTFAGATGVPGAPAHVAGLIQVRGRVLPVIDLRTRFGISADAPRPEARVVVVQNDTRTVGLLADSAREVKRLDPQRFRPVPEVIADGAEGFVKSVAEVEGRLVMLLDLPKVIGQERADAQ